MDTPGDLLELTIENANKIIDLNKKGEIISNFEKFIADIEKKEVSFEDAMGQDNIGRFDNKKPKRKERRSKFHKNRANSRNNKKKSESK